MGTKREERHLTFAEFLEETKPADKKKREIRLPKLPPKITEPELVSVVKEGWITDLQNMGPDNKPWGKAFKVYEKPSAADLAEIVKDGHGDLDVRVLIDTKTGIVYVFSSTLIHSTVINYLKLNNLTTYRGIGMIKQGKIRLGLNREVDLLLLRNPKFDYSELYYRDPHEAFERLKQNCAYMYNPIFTPDSVDALLKNELRAAFR